MEVDSDVTRNIIEEVHSTSILGDEMEGERGVT